MSGIANALAVGLLASSPGAEGGKVPERTISDVNNPAVVEPGIDLNTQGEVQYEPFPTLEQDNPIAVVLEGFQNKFTEQQKKAIEAKGGIFLGGVDYTISSIDSSLGAYDQYGNYYSGAIPEGGILNAGGVKFKLTYETKYFDEVTFLYAPDGSSLKAGQIFPYMVFLPPEAYGKAFIAMNYADSSKSTVREIYTDTREPATYVAMPVITTSPADIISPYYFNADGDMVMDNSKSFQILPGGTTGSTTGYLSWAIMKLTKDESKDYFDLELLGILTVGSDNKLFMELNDVPTDIVERCNLNS